MLLYVNVSNYVVTYTFMVFFSRILLRQVYSPVLKILIINFALKLGSSKQGKACLACVVWNCVEASHLNRLKKKEKVIRNFSKLLNFERSKILNDFDF